MHVSAAELIELIREISNGKSAGIDGLSGEILKYANHILSVLLSISFTSMFKHCSPYRHAYFSYSSISEKQEW